jgi:amylosucrase
MHRPVIDWTRAAQRKIAGSPEQKVFDATQRLIRIRKSLSLLDDVKNLQWIPMPSRHLAGYIRTMDQQRLFCIFNFSGQSHWMDWNVLSGFGPLPTQLWEHWSAQEYADIGAGSAVEIPPYGFFIWQAR